MVASHTAESSAQSGQGIPQSQMGLPQRHGLSCSAVRKLLQATHSVPVVRQFLTMNGSGIYHHANEAVDTPQCTARATYDVADCNKARILCGSVDSVCHVVVVTQVRRRRRVVELSHEDEQNARATYIGILGFWSQRKLGDRARDICERVCGMSRKLGTKLGTNSGVFFTPKMLVRCAKSTV
jgi:hypothetical protein